MLQSKYEVSIQSVRFISIWTDEYGKMGLRTLKKYELVWKSIFWIVFIFTILLPAAIISE